MYFINLDKLTIDKEYQYDTRLLHYELRSNLAYIQILEVLRHFENEFKSMFTSYTAMPTLVQVDLGGEGEATEEEGNNLVSIVNTIIAALFAALIDANQGRQREYRLDVPDKLSIVKMNLSLLKRAINHKTLLDKFNLVINYKDLSFILCDERLLSEDVKEMLNDSK